MKNSITFTKSEIEKLCHAGSLAPSGANAQPWVVDAYPEKLVISIDPKRTNTILDINGYAAVFALGCFVSNVLTASRAMGISCHYKLDVVDDTKAWKTKITVFPEKRVPKNNTQLYQALLKRCTNRKFFNGTLISKEIISKLKKIVTNEKISFYAYSENTKKNQIAKALGKGDAIRYKNDELFSEMMNELRWSIEESQKTRDGIGIETLELPKNLEKMFRLLKKYPRMKDIVPSKAFEEMIKPLMINSSHVCCIAINSKKYSVLDVFEAGIKTEDVWNNATLQGISFQPWASVPFLIIRAINFKGDGISDDEYKKIGEILDELRVSFELGNNKLPMFIFRISYANPPSFTSFHRDWKDFTHIKT